MIMKADVVDSALRYALADFAGKPHILYMSPRGVSLKQKTVHTFAQSDGIIVLCGRYEGVDDRVIEYWRESHGLLEVSVGDYILSGGEIAAFALIDACVRLLPSVVGNEVSLDCETFELDLLEFPQYTKPCVWRGKSVPEILLSGDHKRIAEWQKREAEKITELRRPDLWEAYVSGSCGNGTKK
jgi:tRNA (guanine37-N1)-methyltransferase